MPRTRPHPSSHSVRRSDPPRILAWVGNFLGTVLLPETIYTFLARSAGAML